MAELTRKTVIGIVPEVIEGTPVLPTSGSQFITVQEGFSLEPGIEEKQSTVLVNSINVAATVLGIEEPTGTVDHYLSASEVIGTAPQYGPLLECAIGEEVTAHVTDRATTSGSTAGTSTAAAIIKLAAGGSDFQRGKAILIKDSTYLIRPVHSVSTNDLTLGFNIPSAPGTGILTGRATLYKTADTPPTLTTTFYDGNGGAMEVMAGTRVAELSIEGTARDFLNAKFSLTGTSYYFDPIEITSSNKYLDFNDGSDKTATLSEQLYKDPNSLALAIQTAMNSVSSGITVVYNNTGASAGKFTITKASGTLNLEWNTGANTANTIGTKLGFLVAADDTGSLTYTSDSVQSWASTVTPTYTNEGDPLIIKCNEVMIGDFDDYACAPVQSLTINISNDVQRIDTFCCEGTETINSQREVTVDMTLVLVRHDADKFYRFINGSDTRFAFNFGSKADGVNWDEGKSGCIYIPLARVTKHNVTDSDGIITIDISLKAYSSGEEVFYLNFI